MPIRQTHTVVELPLSAKAYDEIAAKLKDAGYDHLFLRDEGTLIDMSGIGVTRLPEETPKVQTLAEIFDEEEAKKEATIDYRCPYCNRLTPNVPREQLPTVKCGCEGETSMADKPEDKKLAPAEDFPKLTQEPEAIPAGVAYDPVAGTFFYTDTGLEVRNTLLYNKWIDRRAEFPQDSRNKGAADQKPE